MPLIPEDVIDEIQARADIAELVGRYVPLKRAGRHFKANCPFHKEKTPSFMVNTDKQIFHCFGCGVGGNIFSFLMQHDRLTFPEAVQQVADHVGVRLPEREASSTNGEHERLAALMEKVCHYFERQLAHAQQGRSARAYLQKRGVSDDTVRQFRLGLAPAGWEHLLTAATTTGVSADQLEAAGLAIRGTSSHYDRFRNRLMFPIMDVRGRIVGFGGRSLDAQEPKYLNSPETALYTKGRHLFGLAQAKEAIVEKKGVIVVEGYFDCVVLAGAGFPHVVSPLGTALTTDQARLLKRYAEHAILAFDADAAGEQATLRGIDLLVEMGLQVHVAQMPSGLDPDECLRSLGQERFQQLLDQSVSIFDFLVETARRRFPKKSTEEKVRAAQFILPTIAKVPDAMLRSEYVRLLAERLNLDEAAVAQELAKATPRTSVADVAPSLRATPAHTVAQGPERLLAALVLDEPARWQQLMSQLSLDEMTDRSLRRVLEIVAELAATNTSMSSSQLISRLSEEGLGELVALLVQLGQTVEAKEEALEDCLRRLHANARKRHLEHAREGIRSAQEAGDDRGVRELLTKYQELIAQS